MELSQATVAGWKQPELLHPAISTSRHVVSRPYDEVTVQCENMSTLKSAVQVTECVGV
jgi:hypothetical protein